MGKKLTFPDLEKDQLQEILLMFAIGIIREKYEEIADTFTVDEDRLDAVFDLLQKSSTRTKRNYTLYYLVFDSLQLLFKDFYFSGDDDYATHISKTAAKIEEILENIAT